LLPGKKVKENIGILVVPGDHQKHNYAVKDSGGAALGGGAFNLHAAQMVKLARVITYQDKLVAGRRKKEPFHRPSAYASKGAIKCGIIGISAVQTKKKKKKKS